MSNSIGREILGGIAIQSTFGTAEASPTFYLPTTDNTFYFEPVIAKILNEASTGSTFRIEGVKNGNRYANMSFNIKVTEDLLPVFFAQSYDITTTTVATETAVYSHGLSYTNTTNNYYTLFVQDDNRNDYRIQDVLFSEVVVEATLDGFVMLNVTARGRFPESGDYTVTRTDTLDFVGRNVDYLVNDTGSAVASAKIQSLTSTNIFELPGEDASFDLNSEDLAYQNIEDRDATLEVSARFDNTDDYDDFTNNQDKVAQFVITDTSRDIVGSTAGTKPSITFDIPSMKPAEGYTPADGGLNDTLMETIPYQIINKNGEEDSPQKITVVNATSSY